MIKAMARNPDRVAIIVMSITFIVWWLCEAIK